MIRLLTVAISAFALSGCVLVADSADVRIDRDAPPLETYSVDGLPDWAPFSSVARAGDLLFVSGHLGRYPGSEELVPGGAGPQTTQTMANIEASLALVGATLDDLASCTIYLADMADYPAMNEAYAAALGDHRPARATAGVAALALGAAVEIECVAYAPLNPN